MQTFQDFQDHTELLKAYNNLLKLPENQKLALLDDISKLTSFIDTNIAKFLATSDQFITVVRLCLETHFYTIFQQQQQDIINKNATVIALNVNETGTLDEPMQGTKDIIIQALTPVNNNSDVIDTSKDDVVSL